MADPLLMMSNYEAMLTSGRPDEILAFLTPENADDPRVQALIAELQKSEAGRELLERHRSTFEERGIPVPWRQPTETEPVKTAAAEKR
ncbi:MAG: hypothetical protein KatS3mg057_2392 [Herpetosiphonaceae bacterium]|nr:MAG: hypothetical protein KatS3mg057_2392 [Herpetosiphonaceae bacterium]